jgi:hypothetical protein
MANVNVTITKASKHVCTLDEGQPTVTANNMDTITFINLTGKKAILFVPHDNLANNQIHFHHGLPDPTPVPFTITTATKGVYRFGIFCHATNSFAIGSDPEIIVQ